MKRETLADYLGEKRITLLLVEYSVGNGVSRGFNFTGCLPAKKKLPKIGFLYLDYVMRFFDKSNFKGWPDNIEEEISRYQQLLDNTEIDVAIVGIGRNGHIAFNEPGSDINSKCRLVELHTNTIETTPFSQIYNHELQIRCLSNDVIHAI